MNETEFWHRLEYRISDELAEMDDNRLKYLWCDGFVAQDYLLDDAAPRITGRVWICNGSREDEWDYTLFLPHRARSPDTINWVTLLPARDVTRWLALDLIGKRIQIEPGAAVSDFS